VNLCLGLTEECKCFVIHVSNWMFSLQTFFPAMTKIVGTLGPKSRSVEIISDCLNAGMSGISRPLTFITPYVIYFTLIMVGS
jgi:hypothetical protein